MLALAGKCWRVGFVLAFVAPCLADTASPLYQYQTKATVARFDGAQERVSATVEPAAKPQGLRDVTDQVECYTDPFWCATYPQWFTPTDPAYSCSTDPAFGCVHTDPAWGCTTDPVVCATNQQWCYTNPEWCPTQDPVYCYPTNPAYGCIPTDPMYGCVPTDPYWNCVPTDPAFHCTDPSWGCIPTDVVWGCDTDPQWCPTSPQWCQTDPVYCNTDPQWCPTSPQWCYTDYNYCNTDPNWCATSPDWCPTDWNNCQTDPFWCPTHPQWCFTDPVTCPPTDPAICQVGTEDVPEGLSLSEATPNPFNPFTTLSFNLPETGQVRLAVYDLTGRLVKELVKGMATRGTNRVLFDGSELPSGLYVYILEASGHTLQGKMLLVK